VVSVQALAPQHWFKTQIFSPLEPLVEPEDVLEKAQSEVDPPVHRPTEHAHLINTTNLDNCTLFG
jgi:hypothetical protein